jgi:hypothetical protein
MKLTQIADLLNNTLVPNYLGQETTISEDLSNVVELGTAIADLDGEEVKNFAGDFIVGVARNVMDTRKYRSETYGLYNDAREYGGVIQRVKSKLLETSDSPIWTLENGEDYFDGKYYGIETDVKVYSKDTAFQIKNSIPTEMYKQYFTSADGVREFVALIESTVDNTMTLQLNTLARTTLQKMIFACSNDREIRALSLYNSTMGLTGDDALTPSTALYNAPFLRWLAEMIIRLRNLTQDYNKKYNDGTVETFTPADDLRVVMLDEVAKAIDFNMEADTFHRDLVSVGEYSTINFWQNASTDLLPSLGVTAEVKQNNPDDPTTPIVISDVIACIFDRTTCGLTSRISKITAQYIANGDYTTYFHHVANSRFIDTRNTGIIVRLA